MIPRPEYPRPQMVRDGWMNLNGTWAFEKDPGDSGLERGLLDSPYTGSIRVPFCMESRLSGVGDTDFCRAVWYRRTFTLPREALGMEVILRFGAVDYDCAVYVNGQKAGEHRGGYVSFGIRVTPFVREGENTLVVHVRDDVRSPLQPSGKQSMAYGSHGCFYTRTTGIWQTVWLEWMPPSHIRKVRLTPDAENDRVMVEAALERGGKCTLRVRASYEGGDVTEETVECRDREAQVMLPVKGHHLWEAGQGRLYDLELELRDTEGRTDRVRSYFGLRSVSFDGMRFLLNGKPLFQRLVLDQGFYPDGIYTAPSDEELEMDIRRSMAMGFNGARLHQKVFEPRFLYHADRLGYLVWGEMANWGLDHSEYGATEAFLREWICEVERDYSSPAVIGWCPFNETWNVEGRPQKDEVLRTVYRVTKAMDRSRPVIDTSGNFHVETDIYDVHDYDQNPETFREHYGPGTRPIHERMPERQTYGGQPCFVSEYGGIYWSDADSQGWGYGERVRSREEFLERLRGLTDALLDNPDHFGFCYTQLTDVEQEQNGLYTYDRKPKFEPETIRKILSRKAACEA